MKLFSFIWIIIIMAAYLVPCSDVSIVEGNTKYESVKNTADNHQNKTDECSPFCSCSCCSLPTVAQTFFTVAFHPPFYSPVYKDYRQGEFVNVSLPIWQPPQLG